MIKVRSNFSNNELCFVNIINEYLSSQFDVSGEVKYNGDFVRYEVVFGKPEEKGDFVLQFCVRDDEDIESGCCNFVHISNILIPYKFRRIGIATDIITLMSYVATKLKIAFFITGIVNDAWKEKLIEFGCIEDASGDLEVVFNRWAESIRLKKEKEQIK